MINSKNAVFDLDSVIDMLCSLQEKAKEKAEISDDADFKMLVLQYEIIKDRLVNENLPQLYELV